MPEPELSVDPKLGPFISALLCERVLDERDGVKSAIRIIDQISRQAFGTLPATMESFSYFLGLIVRLKAGAARGTYQVDVQIRKPSNVIFAEMNQAVHLPGPEDAGQDLVFNMNLEIDEVGTWWFDVLLNGERWTRVPLRIVYLPQQIRQPGVF